MSALPDRFAGRRWTATLAATLVSTYALDAIASAAGLLLLSSGLAASLGSGALALLLVASYLAWGAGLRVNLAANLRLLQQTGTSTNVLSKGLYDLAGTWPRLRGWRRSAAAVGYVVTELAKEAPYYIAAFGAVLLSETIVTTDALVFLAGANFGAALYETGLARLTVAFLNRR